ncbi:hypothetical protein SISNIDRAFT_453182 [Sistotremastrum niveocremeum HHB9708]|uniref:F-box domain-containing protein n=1 Tax=Sistotremastrum niveocremeum HHB9708 TaxID=1314777 RepID=A0A164VN76_9AGAM|nr:hypothetical protein SISNIDRAFT_453182 [Sistotremastrum niveocremeum HHB9708]
MTIHAKWCSSALAESENWTHIDLTWTEEHVSAITELLLAQGDTPVKSLRHSVRDATEDDAWASQILEFGPQATSLSLNLRSSQVEAALKLSESLSSLDTTRLSILDNSHAEGPLLPSILPRLPLFAGLTQLCLDDVAKSSLLLVPEILKKATQLTKLSARTAKLEYVEFATIVAIIEAGENLSSFECAFGPDPEGASAYSPWVSVDGRVIHRLKMKVLRLGFVWDDEIGDFLSSYKFGLRLQFEVIMKLRPLSAMRPRNRHPSFYLPRPLDRWSQKATSLKIYARPELWTAEFSRDPDFSFIIHCPNPLDDEDLASNSGFWPRTTTLNIDSLFAGKDLQTVHLEGILPDYDYWSSFFLPQWTVLSDLTVFGPGVHGLPRALRDRKPRSKPHLGESIQFLKVWDVDPQNPAAPPTQTTSSRSSKSSSQGKKPQARVDTMDSAFSYSDVREKRENPLSFFACRSQFENPRVRVKATDSESISAENPMSLVFPGRAMDWRQKRGIYKWLITSMPSALFPEWFSDGLKFEGCDFLAH